MARKKSVSFSAKPVHVSDMLSSETSSLIGDFIPATASVTADATPVGPDPGLGMISRTVYRAVYVLSFGCVFGTMMVARLVPGRDIIAKGIGDGAQAAKRAVGVFDGRGDKVHAACREAGLRA